MLQIAAIFGGFLNLIVSVFDKVNGPLADFTIENLMMRKLYSVKKTDDPFFESKFFAENPFA